MKLKEALARSVKSRHVGIIVRCLKHKDGLTYGELYADYCKICEQENIKPIVRTSLHNSIQHYKDKGIVRIEYHNVGVGAYRIGKRVWLVR